MSCSFCVTRSLDLLSQMVIEPLGMVLPLLFNWKLLRPIRVLAGFPLVHLMRRGGSGPHPALHPAAEEDLSMSVRKHHRPPDKFFASGPGTQGSGSCSLVGQMVLPTWLWPLSPATSAQAHCAQLMGRHIGSLRPPLVLTTSHPFSEKLPHMSLPSVSMRSSDE